MCLGEPFSGDMQKAGRDERFRGSVLLVTVRSAARVLRIEGSYICRMRNHALLEPLLRVIIVARELLKVRTPLF